MMTPGGAQGLFTLLQHGPLSDWDVCLVTDGSTRGDDARDQALEADDAFWDDGRIQTLWMPRARSGLV